MSHLNILLERVDPTQNMARYYVLSIEPTLFDDVALIREWGRIGSNGRHRSEFFQQTADAISPSGHSWSARAGAAIGRGRTGDEVSTGEGKAISRGDGRLQSGRRGIRYRETKNR